ncbi:ATP-dependent DNA helicase Q4 [Hylaeus volcanicus]|uniref:ATP-dependent DNA helicase Q4 n=1 Tax=Hylaeus volcanicus TaxID=313075 RepID=UPI0023B82DC3|nr:ATP-dependent DNA helicase Q4 [Hylaeus volcanicus]
MEILEDPVFKTKYQKYKVRVKLWESDFTKKYGRKPNKNDIKEADIKIKESYKMYWKLKTRALEETLMDITFSDEVQDNVSDKTLTQTAVEEIKNNDKLSIAENVESTDSTDKKDVESLDEDRIEITKEKSMENVGKTDAENINPHCCENQPTSNNSTTDTIEPKNIKGVWGDHLSKSNEQVPKKKQTLLIGKSSSFQLSQNKFTSSSFTKRNPRKSLSTSKIKNKSEKNSNIDTSKNTEQTMNEDKCKKDNLDANEITTPMFGEPVKVKYVEHKCATQSISTVQQLMEGHTVNRNLNSGWLERCARQNNLEYSISDLQTLSGTSDSGVESMESSIQSPKEDVPMLEPTKSVQISEDEDFICNSDSEEERRHKRIRNIKKRLSDQENYPAKRLCVDNCTSTSVELLRETSIVRSTGNVDTTSKDITNKNTSNVTNLVNGKDKCSDEEKYVSETKNTIVRTNENSETISTEIQPSHRKSRRRIKHISSDDSDPDFDENDQKQTKQKVSRKTRPSSSRKNKTKETNSRKEKKNTAGTRRSSRNKKNASVSDEDLLKSEEGLNPEDTRNKEPAIYAIETLQTVPRFAVRKSNRGDLIEQCAKSVSLTNDNPTVSSAVPTKPKGKLTDKEKLEKKVSDGKINENFVRINLKKKVFVRGKKNFNFSKYKKNQWKQKKKELGSGDGSLEVADFVEKHGILTCFKCGDVGHFSRNCPNRKGDDLIALEEIDEGSQFPTLEEAQQMASQNAVIAHSNRIGRLPQKPSLAFETKNETKDSSSPSKGESDAKDEIANDDLWEPIEDEESLCGHKIPEDLIAKLLPPEIAAVPALYKLNDDQSYIDTPPEVFETLRKFGHETFRPGQEKAIMRILSGQSTLVTLSTGSGKSLCYQLPAYLYSKHSNCITLVISPLVSLMDDQVTGVPSFLSAACLHTNQTQKVRDNVLQRLKQGKLNILLVSPEAVVAGDKSSGFGGVFRQLPPIAFACIDEAHCISQWSHNFRPSYLMVSRVLREKLGVKTVLALTATARKATCESIVKHLNIHDGMAGVISDIPMPRNLLLTVSKDENKDQALIELLLSERFRECNSIIVYCTRREECERIAGLLRVSLPEDRNVDKPNSKLSPLAEPYHAGLSAYRRKIVQKAFMDGLTKIVVATVAFGMGINKSDIRAVVHYNMPGTFESYVQEVGRAGRDGLLAHCHLFLHPKEDNDKWELRRHIYADGVDRHTIRRLLQKVFIPCSCAELREKNADCRCPGHEVAMPVDETVVALDISEETISTLLCYLELHPKRFITVLSSVYVRARVSSYNGPQGLKRAVQSSPPLAMAIALDLQKGISHEDSNVIEFPIVDIASAIGWDSGVVKSHLKSLEWKTVDGASKRSAISVRYDKLGLRVRAPGDLREDELDEALDALFSRAQSRETSALQQLETISVTLHKFSTRSVRKCLKIDEEITNKSDQLKSVIRNYFEGEVLLDIDPKQQMKVENEAQVVTDVRNLIVSYRESNFNGRAIARIFHGIQSPNYPAYIWNKCRFWRAHLSSNFNALCQIATREILALR